MTKGQYIKTIMDCLSDYGGIIITKEQAEDIFEKVNPDGGMDTLDREQCMGYIAKKITGMEWPIYGNTKEYKTEFNNLMVNNAKEKGYILSKDWKLE